MLDPHWESGSNEPLNVARSIERARNSAESIWFFVAAATLMRLSTAVVTIIDDVPSRVAESLLYCRSRAVSADRFTVIGRRIRRGCDVFSQRTIKIDNRRPLFLP